MPVSLHKNLDLTPDENGEVSIYRDDLTTEGILENMKTIKRAFPSLPLDFYDLLIDRLKAKGFTNDRLNDAVIHVIDTCKYPVPTIADFLSYDKKILKVTTKKLDEIR